MDSRSIIDEYTNFNNFGTRMISLLRIYTGENWNLIMIDISSNEGPVLQGFTSAVFILITTFIMPNLFVLVIAQSYQDYKNNPKTPSRFSMVA